MQGAGNDYVYIDLSEESVEDPEALAILLSDRHFGVGGDGVILIADSSQADGRMIMFNADGSEGSMCGNGVRCVAKYLFDHERIGPTATIETKSGLVQVEIMDGTPGEPESLVRVCMGAPRLVPEQIPTSLRAGAEGAPVVDVPLAAAGREFRVTCVSMGNPHAVIFVEDPDALDLPAIGPLLERHSVFPERANIEFVAPIARTRFRQRTWERGSGETLACGTGACATLVAATLNGLADRKATVELRGGELEIEWRPDGEVLMTGPAAHVFVGEIEPGQVVPRPAASSTL